MRVLVIGAGGTGGFFGGLLARAGEDVTFVARGATLEVLRSRGLRVKSKVAGDFQLSVKVVDQVGRAPVADLVLVCVKSYDLEGATEGLQAVVGPQTMLLALQNGVEKEPFFTRMLGPEPVLGCIAQVYAYGEEPGVVCQTAGAGRLFLGEWDGRRSSRVEQLGLTLERAGIKHEVREDIQSLIWKKFAFICGYAGVTALTRLPIGPLIACTESFEILEQAAAEVIAVARSRNIGLASTALEDVLRWVRELEPWASSSMAADLIAGRQLEIEALNGSVVKIGSEAGVQTPVNRLIYSLLKPHAQGARQSG